MIFAAEDIIYLAIFLMLVLSFKGSIKERKGMLLTAVSVPVAVLLIKIIHLFFFESRPYVAQNIIPLTYFKHDASFPSVHTTIMSALAFSYIFYKSKWSLLFFILLIVVGVSRIYTGVHYPLDIIGGIMVGVASIFIGHQLICLLKDKIILS